MNTSQAQAYYYMKLGSTQCYYIPTNGFNLVYFELKMAQIKNNQNPKMIHPKWSMAQSEIINWEKGKYINKVKVWTEILVIGFLYSWQLDSNWLETSWIDISMWMARWVNCMWGLIL